MRIHAILGGAYALLGIGFAVAYDASVDAPELLLEIVVWAAVVIHPVFGFLVPRWWALLLPFAGLLAILPFSEPDEELFGITDAGLMFLGGFFAMLLVAFGIAGRLTVDAFREPR